MKGFGIAIWVVVAIVIRGFGENPASAHRGNLQA